MDDADHIKDIRTKDYSVNEIKTKVDAADTPRVYEKAELKRIVANAEQIGDVKVWRGKEAEQFLNQNGANGMYLLGEAGQPGALVLRESASGNVIMEELLHLEQHRILGFRELSTPDFIRLEIEAQEALLKYAKASKWTEGEIRLIEENQQYWRSEQTKVSTDSNYAVEFESKLKGLKNVETYSRDYKEIEIIDRNGSPVGEFDGIDMKKGVFIEDKSASGISRVDPRTNLPFQTEVQWSQKHIVYKSTERIKNLTTSAVATRTTTKGSSVAPSLSEIINFKHIHFQIDADYQALRTAVNNDLLNLAKSHPDWIFTASFGK